MIVPIALGYAASAWLRPDQPMLVHLFVGATLSATSVGITARVLKDLGVTQKREGQIILGAAILDDVLGLIVLAVVGGMVTAAAGGPGGGLVVGPVSPSPTSRGSRSAPPSSSARPASSATSSRRQSSDWPHARAHPDETLLVGALALCFTLAFAAERIGLQPTSSAPSPPASSSIRTARRRSRAESATLNQLLHSLSSFFVPLFFVVMGMQVHVQTLATGSVLGLATVLIAVAVVSKLVCGFGVVTRGVNRLAVGLGMLPRGEVG